MKKDPNPKPPVEVQTEGNDPGDEQNWHNEQSF